MNKHNDEHCKNYYYKKYSIYKNRYIFEKLRYIYGGNNSYISMEKLEKIINKKFQTLLKGSVNPEYHKFFESHDWWLNSSQKWINEDAKIIEQLIKENDPDKKYSYNKNINIKNIKENICKYVPKKTISAKLLEEFYKKISDRNINDYNKILEIVYKMLDYNQPSTIKDLPSYLDEVKNSDNVNDINVIVAGAGPVGLYTALYLNKYYNENYVKQKINILLLDNRIAEEGIKLPYYRVTQFGFNIDQFQPFIEQIFCWKNMELSDHRHFDFIIVLENLLYLQACHKKIPMYFTKKYETFDKLKSMAKKYNFNYILDCTGGRLGAKLEGDIKWTEIKFKKDNWEVKYVGDNMYRFFVDNKEYEFETVVLNFYDKNYKPFLTGNLFGFITNDNDEKIVNKYKNKCYNKEDFKKLIRHIKDDSLRYLYFKILIWSGYDENKIKYVKITTFNSNSHHVNRVAKVLDKNLMYIGLGDTLGNSELGIYFGMKDAIAFSNYVCNLLGLTKPDD